MNKLGLSLFLRFILMVWLILLAPLKVEAANQSVTGSEIAFRCPEMPELEAGLSLREDKLTKLRAALGDFTEGKPVLKIPPEALFQIAPEDPQAVAGRVKELRSLLMSGGPGAKKIEDDLLLRCAQEHQYLRAQADRIVRLEQDVARLRLQFFELPREKRQAILHPQKETVAQADAVKQLREEHNSALEVQQKAVQTLERVEQQALTADSAASRGMAAERTELERVKSEMTTIQVKWLLELEQQAHYYQDITKKLAAIGSMLLQHEQTATLQAGFQQTVALWRELVDKTAKVVNNRFAVKIPDLPPYPQELLGKMGDSLDVAQYIESYRATKNFREELLKKIGERLQESVDLHYRVLLQSGELRSQLLNLLLDRGDRSILDLSEDFFADIQREFKIVPHRWTATFYLRALSFRHNLASGWKGVADDVVTVVELVIFFLIPVVFWNGTKRLVKELHVIRAELARRSRTSGIYSNLALIVQRLIPYVPWLVSLLAIRLADALLARTDFAELSLLLPYISYYIYYRLFRQIMQFDYVWVNRQIRAAKLEHVRSRADVAVRSLGISALLIFWFLHAVESLSRRGLIFHIATRIMAYLAAIITIGFAYQWRELMAAGLENLVPGKLGQGLSSLCRGRASLLFCAPAFLLIVVLLLLRSLKDWGGRFDVSKKLAAEIFRYQLESTASKAAMSHPASLPEEYRRGFSLIGVKNPETLIPPPNSRLQEARQHIARWNQNGQEENSLAIIGDKGMGKTCLLQYLEGQFADLNVMRAPIPAKLTSRQAVLEFFGELLGIPLQDGEQALAETDGQRAKTLLLIDDAHNLFLGKLRGFEGVQTLLAMLNTPTNNLFWCLAFNHCAWAYLDSFNARHQYIGKVIRQTGWTEGDIQKLLLSAHGKTPFRLSYDDIINAAGTEFGQGKIHYIESKFFRLLWQQSKGNPRLAVYLWLSALRQVGDDALRVGLPIEAESVVYSGLSEDALFVYASIARHENLSLSQTIEVTRLPEGVVRQVLQLGINKRLLELGLDHQYRFSILYQYPLLNYLSAKHFLYE